MSDNPNDPNNPNRPSNPSGPGAQRGPNENPPERGRGSSSGPLGETLTQAERTYSLSITPEQRQRAFEIEDARWSRDNQIKDWLKLLAIIIITDVWCLIVYFLTPGLR
jgi:hypothetical protein